MNLFHSFFICFNKNSIIDDFDNNNNLIYIECISCYSSIEISKIKAFYPCGHRNICSDCYLKISNNKICPYCKSIIIDSINIYDNIIYE